MLGVDLAHIHNKFLSPLPSSAEEFSVSLLAHFPTIIDTKYLMKFLPSLRSSWKKKHTSLNAVYSYLCQSKDMRAGTTRFAGGTNQLFPKAQIDIVAGFKRLVGFLRLPLSISIELRNLFVCFIGGCHPKSLLYQEGLSSNMQAVRVFVGGKGRKFLAA